MKKLIALIFAFGFAVGAFADRETVDGVTFTYSISNGEATIGNGSSGAISTSTSGDLVIPSELGGCPVTTIGQNAFAWCHSMTSVTIPSSVTTIGGYAFYNCSSLTSVTIPEGVTTIRNDAFYNCNSLASVTLPDSVTTIGSYAFSWCSSLVSVTIPDSLTEIGDSVFSSCSSLESVTIPDSVTTIGSYVFYNCNSLSSVTIGNSVATIGAGAFNSCSSLKSVTIPDSVTEIGDFAFSSCSSLASVTIPDSVTTIGSYVFSWCSSLVSVTIPEGVTEIGDWAFIDCNSLELVTIPEGVKSIKSYAFYRCSSVTSITIPDSVTEIGDWTFFDCTSLTSVTIPDSVMTLGDYAFNSCRSLVSVTIGNSVATIGDYAFYDCSSLASVTIPEGVTEIGDFAFSSCSSLSSVTIGDSVAMIGAGAFCDCSSLKSVTIPEGVTEIGSSAFSSCNSLESVTISKGVTTIGSYVFSWCSSLVSVTIPEGVTEIGSYAFYDCSSLASVTIPNSVTTIGERAFAYCRLLTSVTIPERVTKIGSSAFEGCSSLKTVYVDSEDANRVKELMRGKGVDVDTLTFVEPLSDGGPYKETVDGVVYTFFISNGEATIGDGSNSAISTLTSGDLVIPSKLGGHPVTTIGERAFAHCRLLTSVTIPERVTTIGSSAFSGCSSLTSVTIPEGVTTIEYYAFGGCTSLTSVTIPKSVTTIGKDSFAYCYNLKVIDVGEGNSYFCSIDGVVYSKDQKILIFCPGGKTSVTIPMGVTEIGDAAFSRSRSLLSISIPDTVKTISDNLDISRQVNVKCTRNNLAWIKERFRNNICFAIEDDYPELEGYEIVYENNAFIIYVSHEVWSGYIPLYIDDEVVVNYVEDACLSGIIFDKRDSLFRTDMISGLVGKPECKNCEIAEKYNAYWIYKKVSANKIRILRVLPKWGGSEYCAGYMYVPNSVNIEYKEWICCSAVFEEIGVVRIPCELNGYEVVSIDEERIFRGLEGVNAVYFDSEADKNYGEGEYRYVAISECGKLVKVYDDEMKTGAWAEWLKKYGNDIAKLMSGTDSIYESQEGWSLTYPNWYNYVMGLDPGKMEDLKIDISIVDGKPVVSYTPELDPERAALRKYTTYGKVKLTDSEWIEVSEGHEVDYNFFKVTVEMK